MKQSDSKTVSQVPERVTHERFIEAPETRLVLDKRMIGHVKTSVTTPSVLNVEYWKAKNTGAVLVTNFVNGQEGQHLYILGDGNTTLEHGTYIDTLDDLDLLLAAEKTYHLILLDGKWRQV